MRNERTAATVQLSPASQLERNFPQNNQIMSLRAHADVAVLPRSIPKSASGKILRRVLRDRAKADKSTKVRDDVKEKAKL